MKKSSIKIFKSKDGQTEVEVKLDQDSVWLNQYQMEDLFQTDRTSITRHVNNIYKTNELEENSTCAKITQVKIEGNRKVSRHVNYYNLDVIIAIGYRVNSIRGTEFRIWANKILKEYLIRGFTLNQKRLLQHNNELETLKTTVKIIGDIVTKKALTNEESKGLLTVISDYAYALDVLDKYDYNTLEIDSTSTIEHYKLDYKELKKIIEGLRKNVKSSKLFGHEKDQSFKSSISTIYQTFDGNELYPSIEEKAANLLYLITKNHSFTDGNKRIAALIFIHFIEKNGLLYNANGTKRIDNNALVALTLMIAISNPDEKDTLIKVIVNLINKNN